ETWESGKPAFGFPLFHVRTPGGGNVEISRLLRDFQGTVGGVGKLPLLFHSSHGPAISTAPSASTPVSIGPIAATRSCTAAAVVPSPRLACVRIPCRSRCAPVGLTAPNSRALSGTALRSPARSASRTVSRNPRACTDAVACRAHPDSPLRTHTDGESS